ncbi:MAG TPA: hypothetical protein VJ866_22025 [Pyrinomonadaceae bacterium]|nr:hypothetical protein [Pyrinomonadaceae bacterium]
MKPSPDDKSAPRDLLRLAVGAAAGSLTGAILGAAATGYMQLLEESSGLRDVEMQWVILAAIVGGLGGAAVGAVVGLLTSLILVVRNSSAKAVRLR